MLEAPTTIPARSTYIRSWKLSETRDTLSERNLDTMCELIYISLMPLKTNF